MRSRALLAGLAAIAFFAPASHARAADPASEDTLYLVAVSHLDTSWYWTIRRTTQDFLAPTFADTFDQLDRYPDYVFSWEGSFRYMLLAEYYPELFERLKGYVDAGRWRPAGGAIDGGDTLAISPEAMIRHLLYGNLYFERELGSTSLDVFLPDCFGFGYSLPSVSAHCGRKGFSTQKLQREDTPIDIPFPLGVWVGPDGAEVVAALEPGGYHGTLDRDYSSDQATIDKIQREYERSGVRAAFEYFGRGDRGGAVPEESAQWLQASIDGDGPVAVVSAASDQLFRDLTPGLIEGLPRHDGELIFTLHGTGCYTSQAALKRWNRRNELLGDAAERAAVAAAWLGGSEYPRAQLEDAWVRFLLHHMHDDYTGTGIPEVYDISYNDELLSHNRFAGVLTEAVGAVARGLDTRAMGTPLVVYNPLALERDDIVEATVRYAGAPPRHVRVYDPDGEEVPSQITGARAGAIDLVFLAALPPAGFAVFDVRPAGAPCALQTGLTASAGALENERYRVTIDVNGDIASVHDKTAGQALLSGPARLLLFDDQSAEYPAWELLWVDYENGPRGYVQGPARVEVVEQGPARVAVEITRSHEGSTWIQRVRLAAGGAGHRAEVSTEVDWQTLGSFCKASFPLAVSNPQATYDLGLGTIQRGNITEKLYEVPGQQWADITAEDQSFGVSVLNDCKYGWDKPDDATLRLTLFHTPVDMPIALFYHHHTQDIGPNRFTYALYGHQGDWRQGSVTEAARLNQPPLAFQTEAHEGALGKEFSFLRIDSPAVIGMALKRAERSEDVILRVRETRGQAAPQVRIGLGDGVAAAREVTGEEQDLGPATLESGALVTDFSSYQVRSFALTLAPPPVTLDPPGSRPVALPLDTDVVSFNADREDGAVDPLGGASYAGELFPETLTHGGIRYELGTTGPGEPNAVTCSGQTVALDPQAGDRLYLLAAGLGDTAGTFTVGQTEVELAIQDYQGRIGGWVGRVVDGEATWEIDKFLPEFHKHDRVAYYGTHRHRPAGDDLYWFTYLFEYVLPVPEGATTLTLPDNDAIRVFAATLAGNPNRQTFAASRLHDGHDPEHAAVYWAEAGSDGAGCGCGAAAGAEAWRLLAVVLLAGAAAFIPLLRRRP